MTIIALTGVFDIVHVGHLKLFEFARQEGRLSSHWSNVHCELHVLIDTDERVKELKGASRPINSLSDRMQMLHALGIDGIHPFNNEETKIAILEYLKPNLFIKGGDYTLETVSERKVIEKNHGKVVIAPFIPGYSTTNIVKKMSGI